MGGTQRRPSRDSRATPPSSVTEPAEPGTRRWLTLSAIATVVSVVVLYIWDDVLFAGPIIAVAGITEPWIAFVVFSILYSFGSYVLAILGVRAYERWSRGEPSRFAQWLARQEKNRRVGWGRRLLESSKILGFVVASFALGGILTTFFIRYSGRREGIEGIAALSSLIFGVTFVAVYAGVASAIFAL